MNSLRFSAVSNRVQYVPEINRQPGRLILVSGPSGVGKGSIISGLFEDPQIRAQVDKVPSLTTRAPRPGEVLPPLPKLEKLKHDTLNYLRKTALSLGIPLSWLPKRVPPAEPQYEFVSKADFEKLDDAKQLFQTAVYDGNYYGSRTSVILDKLTRGVNVMFELASQDALQIKKDYPNKVTTVCIAPPEATEGMDANAPTLEKQLKTLQNRLIGRGTNSDDSIRQRLEKAKSELALQPQFDTIIVNEDNQLGKAIAQLRDVATRTGQGIRFSGIRVLPAAYGDESVKSVA